MALDGAFLYAVRDELTCLLDGRVEKVHQPSRETIVLSFRTREGAYRLLISAAPSSARVHITETLPDNPKQPPMFCMLLRKHLSGGRLTGIRQDGLERILFLDFRCTNELGDPVGVTIACEIMGRHSNLIVLREDGTIIDSLRRVDAEMSRERLVLPGMPYALPPRDARLCFLTAEPDALREAFADASTQSLPKVLIAALEGVSPILAREWAFYALRGETQCAEPLTAEQLDRLLFIIRQTREALLAHTACFTAVRTKEGLLKDFSFLRISQYGSLMLTKTFDSACALLDYFYAQRDRDSRIRQRANDMFHLLVNTSERISKRLSNQREELAACEKKEVYKNMGDLLSANLYQLQKGDAVARVADFYADGMPEVEIPLDVRLTPSQNAQRYYAKYRKAGTAEQKLTEQIAKGEEELAYIDSVFDAMSRADSEDALAELRLELAEQGYLRMSRQKGGQPKSAPPLQFRSSDGFLILVGRNNKQNDRLTLKQAAKLDIWFHTHNLPGSHVILVTEGAEVPDRTMEEAALLAAYHSKAAGSAQVPVDYCPVRFVKKPPGAKPGMVIFSNYHTAYVTPDEGIVTRCAI